MLKFDNIMKQHIAVLGKTGSGKTSTAKLLVEQVMFTAGARVCILDPIKSDWWGLISSEDGKRPGLPFQILGGPQQHVPLHADAGKAIGELVAKGTLPLSIIDMADFRPGGQAKFFTAFAESLMKHMRGVLYLVIEEAHEFAPKERSGVGDENMSVYYAKKLATAGRSKGIRLVVCSQRVQALHNAVLGSCDTVIVHRMTAPADQEPVIKWLRGNVQDKIQRAAIEQSLPKLKTGEGWVCSGDSLVPERIQFPRICTFDNSSTPQHDSGAVHVVSEPVDTNELRELIGDAIKEAEANDPKVLKASIADLQAKLSSSAVAVQINTNDAMRAEYQRGREAGHKDGYEAGCRTGFSECRRAAMNKLEAVARDVAVLEPFEQLSPATEMPKEWFATSNPARPPDPRLIQSLAGPASKGIENLTDKTRLSPSARKIVDVIHRSYPVGLTFAAAARRAGISNKSSAYSKYCKEVMSCHEVDIGDGPGGRIRSRPEFAHQGAVTSLDGVETWIAKLPPSYGNMLRVISIYGPIGKDRIASEAEISPTSSGLGSGLRELLDLELIVKYGDRYQVAEGL